VTELKATPTTPAEWEEYVHTALATPEAFSSELKSGDFKKAIDSYVNSRHAGMEDLKGQLTEQVTASVMDLMKRNGVRPDSARPAMSGRPEQFNPQARGAGMKVWASGGQMLQDVLTDPRKYDKEQAARMQAYADFKAAYTETVPGDGGYLVPEEIRSEIMTRALEMAIVRPKATIVPVGTGKMSWPVNDFTTEVGEVFGGVVMSWLDEGQEFGDTSGSFAALELDTHQLGGLATLPNSLIKHAPALNTWVQQKMPEAVIHFEDLGFLKGNGVKKPLGGLHANNPALIVVTKETGQPAATITWLNVLGMFSRMLPESYGSAEWDITPDAIPEIFTMALPVGVGGSAVMVGEGGGPGSLPMSMLGIPIRWTRKAPAVLGTQGDISLVDWSNYVIGDDQAIMLDSSTHSKFTSNKTQFRIVTMIDGQPGMLAPLTPENNGPTLSAYVQLATRS
jgi:HK97 family phage major capsid protein